jgi:serine/threonine protein kinase
MFGQEEQQALSILDEKYGLIRMLGAGSFGNVFGAKVLADGTKCVAKILKVHRDYSDPSRE